MLYLKGNKAGQGLDSDELGEVMAWIKLGGQGRLVCNGNVLHLSRALSKIREQACGYLGLR